MKYLSEQPNLDFLRREARSLRAKHRAKDQSVFQIIGHYDTSFHGLSQEEVFARKFSIIDAQRVTARLYSFASWRRLKLFVQKSTQKTNEFNPELTDTLLRRNEMRVALIRRAKDAKANSLETLSSFNIESQEIVRGICEQYGWPSPQLLGRQGSEACYWLAVSQSDNSQFQYEYSTLMKEALPRGECFGARYATTIDRWLCLSYRPTIYGSFNDFNEESGRVEFTSDVVDRANLNKRRAEVGLMNFESANRELEALANEQKWPEIKQSEWSKIKRRCALQGGYTS